MNKKSRPNIASIEKAFNITKNYKALSENDKLLVIGYMQGLMTRGTDASPPSERM
jgi:hypothetical protein